MRPADEVHIEAEAVPVEKQLQLETDEHSKDELVQGLGQLVCQSVRTLRIRLALFIVLIIWNNRGLLWMIYAYLVLVPVRIRYMYVSQWLNGPNVGIYE